MVNLIEVSREAYDHETENQKLTFLQKSYWGDLKKSFNEYSPKFYVIYNNDKPIGAFQALERNKKFLGINQKIVYIPRTNLLFKKDELLDKKLFSNVIIALKKLNSITLLEFDYPIYIEEFIKPDVWKSYIESILKDNNILNRFINIQPKFTIIKELQVENLFDSIPSSNAKRNIKRGKKKLEENGVVFEVKKKLDESELKEAYDLITEVSEEKSFNSRSFEYFQRLQESPEAIWYIFRKEGKIVLANIGIINESTSTYYDQYVGRVLELDKLYISYVLKFNAFNYLKEKNIKYYDHWGIDLDKNSYQQGYSQFKLHFGGVIIDYPPIAILGSGFNSLLIQAGLKVLKIRKVISKSFGI